MRIVLYSIPAFFLLIFVELFVSRLLRRPYYRLNDTVNDLSCGIASEVFGLFSRLFTFGTYVYLFEHFAVQRIPESSWPAWIAAFVLYDHQYYWFHRWAHRANAPWAAHVVHHQSEEYNLAVALRQSSFQGLFSFWFYLPMALLGFSPVMLATVSSINLLYQFWVHTRLIRRLGPLEWVFNAPAHHRVHHGRNPKYLDKNYAGVFIVWDRLYGTFQDEEEEVVYGVTEPLNDWNPVWANFKTWRDIARSVRGARWYEKIQVWFMPPGWVPSGRPPKPPHPEVDTATIVKYDPEIPRGLGRYLLLNFVLVVPFAVLLLAQAKTLPALQKAALVTFVVMSLMTLGALFDRKRWAFQLEPLRLMSAIGLAAVLTYGGTLFAPITLATLVAATLFAVSILRYRTAAIPAPHAVALPHTP
jgi:sterol desaturase/sphingolipid hydroxylase (fatty acid hydroxylase superfamily)